MTSDQKLDTLLTTLDNADATKLAKILGLNHLYHFDADEILGIAA